MSEAALALAFFDPDRRLYGTARSGATLLFEDTAPTVHPEGPAFERRGGLVAAELEGRLSLEAEPLGEDVDLGGVTSQVCSVRGSVGGTRIECLGTLSETRRAPSWDELDALRSVSVLVDPRHAVLALSRRPRGAPGHGKERVGAAVIDDGVMHSVEDARISTVYDAGGRQRSAGLELWLPGEEFARRGSGSAIAGSSLELESVRVQAAVFRWRVGGREGLGAYELLVRREGPAAA